MPIRHEDPILGAYNCPYCNGPAVIDSSIIVYGKWYGLIYICRSCEAYVGCHPGTNIPLGRLANKELRQWKKAAHNEFDKIWKSKTMKRSEAYSWLSNQLQIEKKLCHIGFFTVCQCRKVVEVSKKFLNQL